MTTQQHLAPENSSPARSPIGRILLGFVLLLPAGLCCISSLVVPTINTLIASLQKTRLLAEAAQFIGLRNYTALFDDPIFSSALSFTLLQVVVRILVVTLVPLLLALVVYQFGRTLRILVRLLFTVPLALFAPAAIALTWSMMLNPAFGISQKPWLADPRTARLALLSIDGLYTLGLACGVGLIFYLAALRTPDDQPPTRKKVLVPLIATWVTGLLATIALTLQSFTLSFVLTAGGPRSSWL